MGTQLAACLLKLQFSGAKYLILAHEYATQHLLEILADPDPHCKSINLAGIATFHALAEPVRRTAYRIDRGGDPGQAMQCALGYPQSFLIRAAIWLNQRTHRFCRALEILEHRRVQIIQLGGKQVCANCGMRFR
jgi:hypothetical protein